MTYLFVLDLMASSALHLDNPLGASYYVSAHSNGVQTECIAAYVQEFLSGAVQ